MIMWRWCCSASSLIMCKHALLSIFWHGVARITHKHASRPDDFFRCKHGWTCIQFTQRIWRIYMRVKSHLPSTITSAKCDFILKLVACRYTLRTKRCSPRIISCHWNNCVICLDHLTREVFLKLWPRSFIIRSPDRF